MDDTNDFEYMALVWLQFHFNVSKSVELAVLWCTAANEILSSFRIPISISKETAFSEAHNGDTAIIMLI